MSNPHITYKYISEQVKLINIKLSIDEKKFNDLKITLQKGSIPIILSCGHKSERCWPILRGYIKNKEDNIRCENCKSYDKIMTVCKENNIKLNTTRNYFIEHRMTARKGVMNFTFPCCGSIHDSTWRAFQRMYIKKYEILCYNCELNKSRDERLKIKEKFCSMCNETKPIKCFGTRYRCKTNSKYDKNKMNNKDIQGYVCYCFDCLRKYHREKGKEKRESSIEERFKMEINSCKTRTKKRNKKGRKHNFDIDLEYLLKLWKQCDGKCEKLGIQMTIIDGVHKVSIDRLDNDKGYIEGNIQLVCWVWNNMKQALDDKTLDKYIKIRCSKICQEDCLT